MSLTKNAACDMPVMRGRCGTLSAARTKLTNPRKERRGRRDFMFEVGLVSDLPCLPADEITASPPASSSDVFLLHTLRLLLDAIGVTLDGLFPRAASELRDFLVAEFAIFVRVEPGENAVGGGGEIFADHFILLGIELSVLVGIVFANGLGFWAVALDAVF